MKRRDFLATAGASTLALAHADERLLLPSDEPDELGFRTMWYTPAERIDPKTWRLKAAGLVEKPAQFSLAELRALPQETQSSRMKCVQCWSSRAEWGGFRFGHLVELLKPKAAAKAVRIDCADKWYDYFTLAELIAPRVLMTVDMAGKPLPDRNGAPLRLIDPSRYGHKSSKQIVGIEFVTEVKGSLACDIGPYYTQAGTIQAGYDHPLDLGKGLRKKIAGGEISEY
jgi:sulfoxide reductase catalytic subunit YedY